MLTASLSRKGGGLFDAVCGLSGGLSSLTDIDVEVGAVGLQDEFTEEDRNAWTGLATATCPVVGPRAFGYSPGLSRTLAARHMDLLHVHGLWMYPSAASLRWSRRTDRPVVISPHGMLDPWAVRNSRWKKRFVSWLFEDCHLRRAACLHTLCDAEARAIWQYGLNNPVCVIPNGVGLPADEPKPRAPWRAAVPPGAKVLLYLGRLHPKKNLQALLEAWHQVANRPGDAQDWWLVVAGWDQQGYESALRQFVAAQGVPRVWFAGPQFGEGKDACFRNADAFILPSLSEGLPMVVLEAWSYRLPVLMTPECNLPSGFDAGAALRIGAAAGGIRESLQDVVELTDAERQAMGERGRAMVEQEFSWQRIAEEMLVVYRWVIGDAPMPACVVRET